MSPFLESHHSPSHSRKFTRVITPPSNSKEEHPCHHSRAGRTPPRAAPPSIDPPLPIDDRLSHCITMSSLLHPKLSIPPQFPPPHHYTHLKQEDLSPCIDRYQAGSLGAQHDVSQEVKHQSYNSVPKVDHSCFYSEPTLEAALPSCHFHPQSFTVPTQTCLISSPPNFQKAMQRIPDDDLRQSPRPFEAYLSDPFIASLLQFLPKEDPKKKFISETYRSLTPQKSSFIDTSKITDSQIKKQIEQGIKTLTELRDNFQISFAEYIFLIQNKEPQERIEKTKKNLLYQVDTILACEAALEKLFKAWMEDAHAFY